jgi:hypothetical protein
MDGLVFLLPLTVPGWATLMSLGDLGVLIASVLLAIVSALALARQIYCAIQAAA